MYYPPAVARPKGAAGCSRAAELDKRLPAASTCEVPGRREAMSLERRTDSGPSQAMNLLSSSTSTSPFTYGARGKAKLTWSSPPRPSTLQSLGKAIKLALHDARVPCSGAWGGTRTPYNGFHPGWSKKQTTRDSNLGLEFIMLLSTPWTVLSHRPPPLPTHTKVYRAFFLLLLFSGWGPRANVVCADVRLDHALARRTWTRCVPAASSQKKGEREQGKGGGDQGRAIRPCKYVVVLTWNRPVQSNSDNLEGEGEAAYRPPASRQCRCET